MFALKMSSVSGYDEVSILAMRKIVKLGHLIVIGWLMIDNILTAANTGKQTTLPKYKIVTFEKHARM